MPVSMIQLFVFGRLLAPPIKSSLQVIEKPGTSGTAALMAGMPQATAATTFLKPILIYSLCLVPVFMAQVSILPGERTSDRKHGLLQCCFPLQIVESARLDAKLRLKHGGYKLSYTEASLLCKLL